jgi:hypothetical protein
MVTCPRCRLQLQLLPTLCVKDSELILTNDEKLLPAPPLMLSGPKATPTPPPTPKPKTPPSNPSAKGKPSSAKKPNKTKPEWMKGMSDKEIRDSLGSPQPGPNRYAKGGWMKGLSARDVRSTLGLTERGTDAGKTAKPEWMKGMSDKRRS